MKPREIKKICHTGPALMSNPIGEKVEVRPQKIKMPHMRRNAREYGE